MHNCRCHKEGKANAFPSVVYSRLQFAVGVTLKINHLQQCRWFFRVLFRAVFTAKSGIYLNQCVNRKIPMNTAIETIEKCSDA